MFKKILVPTDGSELSDKAVKTAIDAARQFNGSIVGLCVAHPYPFLPLTESPTSEDVADYEKRSLSVAQQYVERISSVAAQSNVPCETMVVKSFDPYKEIIDVARKKNCDSIFMASHGRRGFSRWLLGSETQKVLIQSDIPVFVCK